MSDRLFLKNLTPEAHTVLKQKHKLALYKQELTNIRKHTDNIICNNELHQLKKEAELLEKKIHSLNLFFITRLSKL